MVLSDRNCFKINLNICIPDCVPVSSNSYLISFQFSRKFYIAQWFRDTTLETEKAMKSQKDEESSEGTHHAKEVETTGQIMHRAENRKKFLRSIIKTTPSQFSTLK